MKRRSSTTKDNPQELRRSEEIAELVGAILGDGNIYDRGPTYVELCGNPITDDYYFKEVLIPIVNRQLGLSPKLFLRDGGLRFRISSKSFVDWIRCEGVPAGEAKASAKIPEFVLDNNELLVCCIRGIFDTDGSVYFDLREAYSSPYPRIDLHMTNHELLGQMHELLNYLGVHHCYAKSKGSIITSGQAVLAQFLRTIGFSNQRHLSRIENRFPHLLGLNRVAGKTRGSSQNDSD